MRAGQDAERAPVGSAVVEVDAERDHPLEHADRRPDVVDARLDGPGAEAGGLDAAPSRRSSGPDARGRPSWPRASCRTGAPGRRRLPARARDGRGGGAPPTWPGRGPRAGPGGRRASRRASPRGGGRPRPSPAASMARARVSTSPARGLRARRRSHRLRGSGRGRGRSGRLGLRGRFSDCPRLTRPPGAVQPEGSDLAARVGDGWPRVAKPTWPTRTRSDPGLRQSPYPGRVSDEGAFGKAPVGDPLTRNLHHRGGDQRPNFPTPPRSEGRSAARGWEPAPPRIRRTRWPRFAMISGAL